ncbi:MAG: hypothetical protein ABSG94_10415 [Brevinematales bacterium]|jgi:hypothetical protein
MKINIFFIITACLTATALFPLDMVSPKIYMAAFTSDKASLSTAYIFEEQARTILNTSKNIYLLQEYEITNYHDLSAAVKFLNLNGIQGILRGKLSEQNGRYTLIISSFDMNKMKNTYRLDFTDTDEGLAAFSLDFADWAEKTFPRVEQKVIVKEEIDTIMAGKYEYIKPTMIFEAGGGYSPLGLIPNSSDLILVPLFGAFADMSVRYGWWGFNLGGSYYTGEYSIYAGPELNFLHGLITLTAGSGYENIKETGTSLISNENIGYNFESSFVYFYASLYCHFNDFYAISIGGMIAPIVPNFNTMSYDSTDIKNTQWVFNSTNSGLIFGGFIKSDFSLSSDLGLGLRYRVTFFPAQREFNSGYVFIIDSGIDFSLNYKLTFGRDDE